eukprot:3228852-Pyramimonas_sp.AAC.1
MASQSGRSTSMGWGLAGGAVIHLFRRDGYCLSHVNRVSALVPAGYSTDISRRVTTSTRSRWSRMSS